MTETTDILTPNGGGELIAVLSRDDVAKLRLPWDARHGAREIARIVSSDPQLSLWNTRTGDYLLASPWRHRDEIGNVLEIVGPASSQDLLRAFIRRVANLGMAVALVAEYVDRRRQDFYRAAGMDLIEDIVVYEMSGLRAPVSAPPTDSLRFELLRLDDRERFVDLLELDHRAFPWLWWNSAAEFEDYVASDGVVIEIAWTSDHRLAGYVGTTLLGSWGHLDRIAIDPDLQGHGYGRQALDYAVRLLAARGARRVALSTQARNHVSRALYDSYGFRRTPPHDYRIYGRWLREEGEIPGMGQHG